MVHGKDWMMMATLGQCEEHWMLSAFPTMIENGGVGIVQKLKMYN